MHIYSLTIQSTPERLQTIDLRSLHRQQVLARLRTCPGFLGSWLLVDRAQGQVLILTAWESAETLRASLGLLKAVHLRALARRPPRGAWYEVGDSELGERLLPAGQPLAAEGTGPTGSGEPPNPASAHWESLNA